MSQVPDPRRTDPAIYPRRIPRVAGQEGPVAGDIDEPGKSARIGMDPFQRASRKEISALAPGHFDPMSDVGGRVLKVHGLQMAAHRDPLAELTQVLLSQQLCELGLSRENDLDQLFPVRLQVRDQPDLLQCAGFQTLCLVNDEDDRAAVGILLQKKRIQRIQGTRTVRRGRGDAEFPVDAFQEFRRREAGIEDQGGAIAFRVELIEERPEDGCLPRPDLSRERDESGMIVDPVQQMCESLLVVPAQEDKTGIGNQVERFFLKAEKVEVHRMLPLCSYTIREGLEGASAKLFFLPLFTTALFFGRLDALPGVVGGPSDLSLVHFPEFVHVFGRHVADVLNRLDHTRRQQDDDLRPIAGVVRVPEEIAENRDLVEPGDPRVGCRCVLADQPPDDDGLAVLDDQAGRRIRLVEDDLLFVRRKQRDRLVSGDLLG